MTFLRNWCNVQRDVMMAVSLPVSGHPWPWISRVLVPAALGKGSWRAVSPSGRIGGEMKRACAVGMALAGCLRILSAAVTG